MAKFNGFGKPPEGSGHQLWHYTLNTAHTLDLSGKVFRQETLDLLSPMARRALLEQSLRAHLPEPLERYSVKISTVEGAALFDVYGQDATILTTNCVAWIDQGAEQIWDLFEQLYLKLTRNFGAVGVSRAAGQPERLPYLATYVLPNFEIPRLTWLADFEQCLALTLIEQCVESRKG